MTDRIGRYEIKSEQGRGGMATVYQAFDPRFARDVAIKVLPPQFLHDPMFRERFDREAHTIAALEHAAIVPVYDFGEDEGQPYLVMRYMTGGSLAARMKQGSLSLQESAVMLQRVAAALDEAHRRGIIHRDLKPGNILFDQYGDAFLSDFGIAKLTEATAALTGSTIIGTPAYMSPEQARGEPFVDGRSDIYSLGVILFEMLTGQAPYEADTPMGVAIKHILDPVPSILELNPDLPIAVDAIINRALAKDPDHRYQTATEMAAAVAAAAAGQPLPSVDMPVEEEWAEEEWTEDEPVEDEWVEEQSLDEIVEEPPVPHAPRATLKMPPPPGMLGARLTAPPASVEIPPNEQIRPDLMPSLNAAERMPVPVTPQPPAGRSTLEQRSYVMPRHRGRMMVGCLAVGLGVFLLAMGGVCSLPLAFMGGQPRVEEPVVMQDYTISEAVGAAEALDVELVLTGPQVLIQDAGAGDLMIEGEYSAPDQLDVQYDVRSGTGYLLISQPSGDESEMSFAEFAGGDLELNLPPELPVDLVVRTGAGETTLDLSDLNIRSLQVQGGAGSLEVLLPERSTLDITLTGGVGSITLNVPGDTSQLNIESLTVQGGFGGIDIDLPERGNFTVNLTSGVGSVSLNVPESLPAQITVNSGLANVNMGADRFQSTAESVWQTPDYETAAERITIRIDAGVGSVSITD